MTNTEIGREMEKKFTTEIRGFWKWEMDATNSVWHRMIGSCDIGYIACGLSAGDFVNL
jgi:hypothetical protein